MPRILVVYFSLTGHTRQVAEAIATACAADIEPILDTAGRKFTPSDMIWFAMEAILHQHPKIDAPVNNPAGYDLVIIGTPVWAGSLTPPVRSYVEQHKHELKNLALFCTEGGHNGEHALHQVASLVGKEPVAQLIVTEPELTSGAYRAKVTEFATACTAVGAGTAAPA